MTSRTQPSLPASSQPFRAGTFLDEVQRFRWDGRPTDLCSTETAVAGQPVEIPTYVNEFWTRKQRAGNSLHEVSYRACFKPQLAAFFITRLTRPGDRVYDPFMGRGTTVLEGALLGRAVTGCDINPVSQVLVKPRLTPPELDQIAERLHGLDLRQADGYREDLTVFFHPETLRAICALRSYLQRARRAGTMDTVDEWIQMVAVNRLTGHSRGFFSVYTMPPNQAVSLDAQRKINERRGQTPPAKDVVRLILTKSKSLLRSCTPATRDQLHRLAPRTQLLTRASRDTPEIRSHSVDLVVTSPPFLDVVDYASDNWLRCWFCHIDPTSVPLTITKRLADWQAAMTDVFKELHRVLAPGGHIAFEVGEIKGGRVKLEETVIPCGASVGLDPLAVVINSQTFTKTANCWGVSNNTKGTNTNRIVVFRKPG